MSRFIPVQLKNWTNGRLIQTAINAGDAERHYGGVSKDTRTLKQGDVYVALVGPNFDGHDFAMAALQKGAKALVLAEGSDVAKRLEKQLLDVADSDFDLVLVEDTSEAFFNIAHGYRQSLSASVIGVTGSVGKTTTRRMIHCLVSSQLKAMQTFANLNNEIGLSETLLNAQPDDQVLITEIAMDRKGEIRKIAGIARPDIAMITGIGHSHAEYLGSLRSILDEKTSIVDTMKDNALCIVNGDDPMLEAWAITKEKPIPIWFVASEQNTGRLERDGFPVFWAEDIKLEKGGTHFTARSTFDASHVWPMYIPEPGRHLVTAALFAMAAAYALGLNMIVAAKAAANFENTGSRQRILTGNGVTVIDDAYNASPESMQAALDVLQLLRDGGRSICVIGGMRELGKYSEQEHIALAKAILASKADYVFLTGDETKVTYTYLAEFMARERLVWEGDAALLSASLKAVVKPGDTILCKGSRIYALDKVAAMLVEEN